MALLDGVKLNLGGHEFIVPPLTLKSLRLFTPKLKGISFNTASLDDSTIDLIADVVHAALVRNYPDVTKDDVEELLDMATMPKALMAVLGASGMQQAKPGEGGEGEVRP